MANKIEFYEDEGGKSPVEEFLEGLQPKQRAKALRTIDLLEEFGRHLTLPHSSPVKGAKYKGMYELRAKIGSDISRIFYYSWVKDKFVLLHGFSKKTNKTPKKELDCALRRMMRHEERQE